MPKLTLFRTIFSFPEQRAQKILRYTRALGLFEMYNVYKIWQFLKRFAGTFRRAQTLKLGGVCVLL